MKSPCQNCDRRCAVPNCHNVETCEEWKKYREDVDGIRKFLEINEKSKDDVMMIRRKHKSAALRKVDREKVGK